MSRQTNGLRDGFLLRQRNGFSSTRPTGYARYVLFSVPPSAGKFQRVGKARPQARLALACLTRVSVRSPSCSSISAMRYSRSENLETVLWSARTARHALS